MAGASAGGVVVENAERLNAALFRRRPELVHVQERDLDERISRTARERF